MTSHYADSENAASQGAIRARVLDILRELHQKYLPHAYGKVADYIPELAKANPNWFGICIVTTDGQIFEIGDSDKLFTIQSISKPFVYGMGLEEFGREYVLSRVGVEPTGDTFNSVIKLDMQSKRPHNPMVNAGAIAMTSLIRGNDPTERLNRMLQMFYRYIGRQADIDMPVFMSERTTGHRNRAITHLMKNFGMIDGALDEHLDLYFQQCSLKITCRDLAVMGATLANLGVNPITQERAISAEYIRDILSVMFTCGLYDAAGEWTYRVGLPAKSGVGGGLLAVVPNRVGIAVFSPPLDAHGNSTRGVKVCEELSQKMGLHVFDAWFGERGFLSRLGNHTPEKLPASNSQNIVSNGAH